MQVRSFTTAVRRATAAALALAAGGGMIVACGADATPSVTIRSFLLDWESGRYASAAALTDGDQTTVAGALRDASRQLDAAAMHFELRPMKQNGQTATSGFHASVDLGENGPPWEYDGRMRLRVTGGEWKIIWEPSLIHPRLSDGERFAVVTQVPKRAEIQDAKGRPLVRQTPVAIVGVYPSRLSDPARTTSAVAELTGLDPSLLLGTVRSAPPKTFTPLVTLRAERYRQIRAKLRQVPGLQFKLGTAPYTAKYAAGLIGTVGTATKDTLRRVGAPYEAGDSVGLSGLQVAFQRRLAGTPATKVITVNRQGDQVEDLKTWNGTASSPVSTTIDATAQRAAESALAGLHGASLVAVDASTGDIRAVASRPSITKKALKGKYAPFTGKYTPGEAFTIVSTDALIGTGLRGSQNIPCPASRTVGGKQFRNGATGADQVGTTPTFTQVFGTACGTAFAGLSRKLGAGDIAAAAAQYGIGGNWNLPLSVYTGTVPRTDGDADDDATRAEQTLGQGGITMSPLGMATVAGAVSSGTWRPPQLVTGPMSSRHPVNPIGLNADHVTALRALMRTAVLHGALHELDMPGPAIYGQAGAATEHGHPVMTFIGYRDNLALAVVTNDSAPVGMPSNTAVSTAAKFFRAFPAGHH